jgi:cytochrome c peroxidase
MRTGGAARWSGGRFFVLAAPVLVGLAASVTTAAGPATASRPPADTTLPANPALRSAEARAGYNIEAMAQALSQLDGKLPVSGAGHLGVTGPAPSADLRPLREDPPMPSFPANLFVPDPLNPVFKNIKGPFRPNLPGGDHSNDPTPSYTEEERKKLVEEGKDLFFSTTAFGQRPSDGPHVSGQVLSCASCHSGPGFADNRAHLVGPVRERELGLRKTPGLFGLTDTAPFGWDARNPTLQHQARGAIVSPLEMKSSREPTKRELDALAEFQKTIVTPPAVPGTDFDPERAKRGEILFRTPRPVRDLSGEFPAGSKIACATCHAGSAFTDRKPHRTVINFLFIGDPLFDPGQIGPDGNIQGFDTPSLLGARFHSPYFHDALAGDPTMQKNLLGGGFGLSVLEGDVGATGSAAARRALLETVLPFYNYLRFGFDFTQEELKDLAEFVLSL